MIVSMLSLLHHLSLFHHLIMSVTTSPTPTPTPTPTSPTPYPLLYTNYLALMDMFSVCT